MSVPVVSVVRRKASVLLKLHAHGISVISFWLVYVLTAGIVKLNQLSPQPTAFSIQYNCTTLNQQTCTIFVAASGFYLLNKLWIFFIILFLITTSFLILVPVPCMVKRTKIHLLETLFHHLQWKSICFYGKCIYFVGFFFFELIIWYNGKLNCFIRSD